MSSENPPPLSEHLLNEANKWQVYPFLPMQRTKTNLENRRLTDKVLKEITEWRRTFIPRGISLRKEDINKEPIIWNDVYCREVLQKVPEMVQRTHDLRKLPLTIPDDADWVAYLRESANCLIYGFSLAAIALARSTIESRLREVYARVQECYKDDKEGYEPDLQTVIHRLYEQKLLSREGRELAHKVRRKANDILHERPLAEEALEVFDAARLVILCMAGG